MVGGRGLSMAACAMGRIEDRRQTRGHWRGAWRAGEGEEREAREARRDASGWVRECTATAARRTTTDRAAMPVAAQDVLLPAPTSSRESTHLRWAEGHRTYEQQRVYRRVGVLLAVC